MKMNCHNHAGTPATCYCRDCGKPLCDDCRRDAFGGIFCDDHIPAGPAHPAQRPPSGTARQPKLDRIAIALMIFLVVALTGIGFYIFSSTFQNWLDDNMTTIGEILATVLVMFLGGMFVVRKFTKSGRGRDKSPIEKPPHETEDWMFDYNEKSAKRSRVGVLAACLLVVLVAASGTIYFGTRSGDKEIGEKKTAEKLRETEREAKRLQQQIAANPQPTAQTQPPTNQQPPTETAKDTVPSAEELVKTPAAPTGTKPQAHQPEASAREEQSSEQEQPQWLNRDEPPNARVSGLAEANNPYGVKFTPATAADGATDSGIRATDGGTFARFASPRHARNTAKGLLMSDAYRNLTLDQALQLWSNRGYNGSILAETGLNPQLPVKNLSQDQLEVLLNAIQNKEGVVVLAGNRPSQRITVPIESPSLGEELSGRSAVNFGLGICNDTLENGGAVDDRSEDDALEWFDATLRAGCFPKKIVVPANWRVWAIQPINEPKDGWISVWIPSAKRSASKPHPLTEEATRRRTTKDVYLQGRGRVRLVQLN